VDPPPPEAVRRLYAGADYFGNPAFGSPQAGGYHGYRDYLADRRYITEKFDGVLAQAERLRAPGDLLDVGCGPGLLLEAAGRRGWRPAGIDLNPWAIRYARDELGVEARLGALEDERVPDAAFDAVTMMDVLEHVADPAVLVAQAARLTRPGGVLAVLTPDAGSRVSRALGTRWPELQRPDHLVLFSAEGLASLLSREGYEVHGWHTVGKTSSVATLIADVSPAAPALGRVLTAAAQALRAEDRTIDFDPRTKLCMYATRSLRPPRPRRPTRIPGRIVATNDGAVNEDLRALARAPRLAAWMFDQYAPAVRGRVVEVGAGIGTFSARLLEGGASELLLLEPDAVAAGALERRFGGDPRVIVSRDELPHAPSLERWAGSADLVVCQNVLEHVPDDEGALAAMGAALSPDGRLVVIVPAHPGLFGALDVRYGHRRRYTAHDLSEALSRAGLRATEIRHFNALGMVGWAVAGRRRRARLDPASLRVYEALVRGWRPVEERARPPFGLSLVAHAERRG
jgi:2-polyprenyl-3-methyl-5-hydroxy-6-metoxy-1,4-benzoquinol methylase